MIFECKRTTELSEKEISDFCLCFENVFPEHKKPVQVFKNEYLNSAFGYSYHSLLLNDEGVIVGGYSAIPIYYQVGCKDVLFACAADMMIEKEYRNDFKNIFTIIRNMGKYLKANGVVCFYGFPNDTSYKINLSIIRMQDIASLYTYILPMKVGDAKPGLKWLNPLSIMFSKGLLFLSRMDCSTKGYKPYIDKKRPAFDEFRFKWFNPQDYHIHQEKEYKCVWKLSEFEGIKACFLIDVYPFSKNNFNRAVRTMVKEMKRETGLFIYVGYLPATPLSMIKVPRKVQPKEFHFVAKIIDKESLSEEEMKNVRNWSVNLSSYDLI